MQIQFLTMLRPLIGLAIGGVIGASFGVIQDAAWRRHQKQQHSGGFNNGWAVMPGSMRRVAYLLLALALVQVVCPLIFAEGGQWWVSAGVGIGYGALLYQQLQRRLAQSR